MKIFDSHTHLNDDQLMPDAAKYNQHAQQLGVVKLANVGSNTKLNNASLALAHQFDNMYSIIGWHPEDSIYFHQKEADELIQQLADDKVVALGEIGMDFYQQQSLKESRNGCFANKSKLPNSLNCRFRCIIEMRLKIPIAF